MILYNIHMAIIDLFCKNYQHVIAKMRNFIRCLFDKIVCRLRHNKDIILAVFLFSLEFFLTIGYQLINCQTWNIILKWGGYVLIKFWSKKKLPVLQFCLNIPIIKEIWFLNIFIIFLTLFQCLSRPKRYNIIVLFKSLLMKLEIR